MNYFTSKYALNVQKLAMKSLRDIFILCNNSTWHEMHDERFCRRNLSHITAIKLNFVTGLLRSLKHCLILYDK